MASVEERFTVDTGSQNVSAAFATPGAGSPVLVVAHGAGAGMDHPFLVGFARAANDLGVATMRFNFPYVDAGRRSPDTPAVAVGTWLAAFSAAADRAGGAAVAAGGKSFGGRMASLAVAEGMPAAGLVFLGYPLHAPGKPERIRDEHLYGIRVPMLFVEGTRDPFARADLLAGVLKKLGKVATLHSVEGGDHSFKVRGVKAEPREVGASLAPVAAGFVKGLRA
ncbi:MAG: dienelactone hydrolase family protein [Actinomycetota bacterium]|nr:dienelactone hydrolase family protein [Actinomycetota bacterium]